MYCRIACLHMPAGASSYLERLIGGPISSYSVRYDVLVRHGTQRHSKIVVSVFLRRYGVIWRGTVRYGAVRYGTVRYGTVRYGTVRYGTVRYVWYGTFGTVRYDIMVRQLYGTAWLRTVRYGRLYGTVWQIVQDYIRYIAGLLDH